MNGCPGEIMVRRFRLLESTLRAAGFARGRFTAGFFAFAFGPRLTAEPARTPATVPTGPAITLPMTAPAAMRSTRRLVRRC